METNTKNNNLRNFSKIAREKEIFETTYHELNTGKSQSRMDNAIADSG